MPSPLVIALRRAACVVVTPPVSPIPVSCHLLVHVVPCHRSCPCPCLPHPCVPFTIVHPFFAPVRRSCFVSTWWICRLDCPIVPLFVAAHTSPSAQLWSSSDRQEGAQLEWCVCLNTTPVDVLLVVTSPPQSPYRRHLPFLVCYTAHRLSLALVTACVIDVTSGACIQRHYWAAQCGVRPR
jgi:hypothetical protein